MISTPHTLRALVEDADDACLRGDLAVLAMAARRLVSVVPRELQFEMVAVAELAALAEPLAYDRWRKLAALARDDDPATA